MAITKKNNQLKACNLDRLSEITGNMYESVIAVGNRSKKLLNGAKLAFHAELEDLNIDIEKRDDYNLVDNDIREIVSQRYEIARKPLLKALDELLNRRLEISYDQDI
ncbi:MAG: hypothetical protein AAF335_04855 [Bacteroidota bacterium]